MSVGKCRPDGTTRRPLLANGSLGALRSQGSSRIAYERTSISATARENEGGSRWAAEMAEALKIGLSVYQPKSDAEPLTKRTGASRHGVIAGRLN
jgi:hypothetical protein